ncbi:MAG: hypothetical protein JKY50_19190 [Oleispira sp.]|nr:hypothetical protein [Oleispira sp.]
MPKVFATELPSNALSVIYKEQGAFVDCYYIDIEKDIKLENYIQTFYTTALFKLERSLLSLVTFKRTHDDAAVKLSLGESDTYSIWTVEGREDNQIMLRDFSGNTRSWLMVTKPSDNEVNTRLYFGSVVVPKGKTKNGQASFGVLFNLLGKFHHVYSRALLSAAYRSLLRMN